MQGVYLNRKTFEHQNIGTSESLHFGLAQCPIFKPLNHSTIKHLQFGFAQCPVFEPLNNSTFEHFRPSLCRLVSFRPFAHSPNHTITQSPFAPRPFTPRLSLECYVILQKHSIDHLWIHLLTNHSNRHSK